MRARSAVSGRECHDRLLLLYMRSYIMQRRAPLSLAALGLWQIVCYEKPI